MKFLYSLRPLKYRLVFKRNLNNFAKNQYTCSMPKLENSRQFIIEKTAPVFNKNGYEGTSLSDIKEATGLTKGAVYCNFKDKKELALEALDYNLKKLKSVFITYVSAKDHSTDKLKAFITAYQSIFDEVLFEGGCPILNSATDADDTNPELFSRVKVSLYEWRESIVSIIESGKNKSQIKASTDAESFADAFISLIEGGVLLSKTLNSRKHIESNLKTISRMIDEIRKD